MTPSFVMQGAQSDPGEMDALRAENEELKTSLAKSRKYAQEVRLHADGALVS